MQNDNDLTNRLRDRLLNALHVGSLRPGDRLPSIRRVAQETSVDHRAVASAYRTLEVEGLVEIRGRSGVYVADQDQTGSDLMAETAHWLAGVLADAWKRQIRVTEVHELIRRCTVSARLTVACVESNVDQMTAYRTELEELFGLETRPVYASAEAEQDGESALLQGEIEGADLVFTSHYHARAVLRAAQPLDKPVVVVSLHPEMAEAVARQMDTGEMVLVTAEPEFGERLRAMYAERLPHPDRVRVLLAERDREAIAALDRSRPILLTRAARARLDGLPLPPTLPHSPTLSPTTARELAQVIIRLNMQAGRGAGATA